MDRLQMYLCRMRKILLRRDARVRIRRLGIVALDKQQLTNRIGRVTRRQLDLILSGIDVILGR